MLESVENKYLSKDDIDETLEISDARNGLRSSDLLVFQLDSAEL